MKRRVRLQALLFLLVATVTVRQAIAWSGNVCSRSECVYVTRRICSYRTWLGCCAYRIVRSPQTRNIQYCCAGWRHNGNKRCNIPVCKPGCMNGGRCVRPGRCECPREYTGPSCGQSQCSHKDPCFPGECAPGSTSCTCTEGFTNPGFAKDERCLKLQRINKPQIFQMQVSMSFWDTMKGSYMEIYSLLSDSSGQSETGYIWTNRKKINRMTVKASSDFSVTETLPPEPEYVSDSRFGIVSGTVSLLHTKSRLPPSRKRRRRSGRSVDRFVSTNETLPCTSKVSSVQPATSVYDCGLTHRFDRSLETGDILTVTFNTQSGGFRTLKNLNTGSTFETQPFEGLQEESRVEFRFDHEKPYHCIEVSSCSGDDTPLSVQDFTKNPLEMRWGGWIDLLSGMERYTVEVFPLTQSFDNRLSIREPLEPLFLQQVNHSEVMSPVRYTPPQPGMYAVILEAADLANNTRYVRRLSLYDPESQVTTDPQHHLVFSSANPDTDYKFQNSTTRPIVLRWDRVFRNGVHEDGGLLEAVDAYPQQLENGLKNIPREQDDEEGQRTINAIRNKRGIVTFEVAYQKDSQLTIEESQQSDLPPSHITWETLDLEATYTVTDSVDQGDTIIAWVRATDIMGNQAVRWTEVTFDKSPAEVGELTFQMNRNVPGIPFSSTFVLDAKDMESGIADVKWTFTRSNGTVIFEHTAKGRVATTCGKGDFRRCYCTSRGACYMLDQSYSLSNCHMMVEKEKLATEIIYVQAEIRNQAGIVTSRRMEKGQLTMLNGTEAYYPPQNVRVVKEGDTTVTITWDFPPSCYERTDLWVVHPGSDGPKTKVPVHKDRRRYDIPGLEPETQYSIQLIARYAGSVESDPTTFTFTTAGTAGLTGGEAAGISIGVILLLVLVGVLLAVLVIRRRGVPTFMQSERFQSLRNSLRKSRLSKDPMPPVMSFKHEEQREEPEDLYLAAEQTWGEKRPAWQVDTSSLVLQDQIASGKFADIYRASWSQANKKASGAKPTPAVVAAKILKPGFSTNDANKLMRKIEFFAKEVGTHPSVLCFHGAVLDNEHLGPVMMLEYCELGQLDKWLSGQKNSVNEETMDNLFRFAQDIACGMHYLASKGIVHSRLAARNILLTFLLEVKISGFGPQDVSDSKVPAKWASPEVLEERPATEKSDVWAYGVILWEIFSMGQTPYSDVRGTEMGHYLKSGNRMDKPEYANDTIYKLMQKCWQIKPSQRPTFSAIKGQVSQLITPKARNSGDFYYDTSQIQK